MIELDARIHSDLKWDVSPKEGEPIDWYLNFGFAEELSTFHQLTFFSSYLVAIDVFIEQYWKPYQEETRGVYLYRGSLEGACQMHWTVDLEEDYLEWKKDKKITNRDYFAIAMFSEYVHRLAAALPDEIRGIVAFDAAEISSPSRLAQMVSLEHFSPLEVEAAGICLRDTSIPLGVVLPLLSHSSEESLDEIDAVLNGLETPYRIIPESHLTEEWEGLDELLLFSNYVSPQGRRKVQGFEAAGGRIRERL